MEPKYQWGGQNGTYFISLCATQHLVDAFLPPSDIKIKYMGHDGDYRNDLLHMIPVDQPFGTDVGI